MVRSRLDFRDKLVKALPEEHRKNIYFQPPSSFRMKYPCIVYNNDVPIMDGANNSNYILKRSYRVTVIDINPDSTIPYDILDHLPNAKILSTSVIDNLIHVYLEIIF